MSTTTFEERRIRELESEGMTRSDAQAAHDVEVIVHEGHSEQFNHECVLCDAESFR